MCCSFPFSPFAENLNAYYVYEAKTSLLLRIAESRAGAERLLDARLLDVLTQCYFIEDRPEIDQTMFGTSFVSLLIAGASGPKLTLNISSLRHRHFPPSRLRAVPPDPPPGLAARLCRLVQPGSDVERGRHRGTSPLFLSDHLPSSVADPSFLYS